MEQTKHGWCRHQGISVEYNPAPKLLETGEYAQLVWSLSRTEHTIREACPGQRVTCVGEAVHKGIPVEYCSGSSKYANLFGVSLSTAERLAYQRAGCVGRHGIAITHQSGRRFSVNQAAKSLLPVSCFSVAWITGGVGFDDADMALADAANSKLNFDCFQCPPWVASTAKYMPN